MAPPPLHFMRIIAADPLTSCLPEVVRIEAMAARQEPQQLHSAPLMWQQNSPGNQTEAADE